MLHLHPACPVGVDDSFGPWAGVTCRGGFDFTLLFEESILTTPLQCLFLLALPARALQLAKSEVKVVPSLRRPLKACASVCLLILNIALLALWTRDGPYTVTNTRATVPTAVLVFVASLGLCLLSWLEHDRTVRPSFILSIFLFLSILLDTARARTLWMLGSHRTIPAIFTCTLALRGLMLVLESTEKRSILVSHHQGYSKEVTSSTISRGVFFWLTALFLKGYKNNLTLEDLYPLDPKLNSEPLHKALAEAWEKVPDKATPDVLYITWLRAFARPVLTPVIPKLFQIAFTYTQPFLINAAIGLASMPQMQPYNNVGYGLIGAYVIVYTGIAVSTGQYEWRLYRAASMMRGSVIALIYQKSLRLNLISPSVSPTAALTLVGTDCETIIQGIVQLHELWGGLLEIGIGIYLLYRELGAACAMPVALAAVVMVGTVFVAIPTGKAQALWTKASQDRVTATSKTLGSIKWLRISGLNDMAFSLIRKLRAREMEVSLRFRLLLGISMILLICAPIVSPILTFSTYAGLAARGDNTLTIARAFTSFSLFMLVNKPLGDIIIALPLLASSVASFQRIQDYLNGEERDDNRLTARAEKLGNVQTQKSNASVAHNLRSPCPGENYELAEVPKTSISRATLGNEMIASVQGKFSWTEDSEPVIDISQWNIRRRTFTLVLGPVGCGKSTLLKCLLGELSSFKGTISTNYSGVAYCGQSPWLPNETVRDVIVGRAEFDETWYHTVIKACALERDLHNWPSGDETVAGTMGISMSGGQKHRLSIARALYSRREFLIFDDVFSGLDSSTEDLVFGNLFGKEGLLRTGNMTIVVASSNIRRVPHADEIILLNEKGQAKRNLEHNAETFQAPELRAQPIETIIATTKLQADSTRRLGDPALYKFYARAAGWLTLTTFCVAMAIFAFCGSFGSIWLKWWAEANAAKPNEDLGKWLGVYAALGVGAAVAVLFGMWQLFIVVINKSGVYFHDLLLDTTSRAAMSFYSTVDSGTTVNRFGQDLQLIDMELPAAALGVAAAMSFGIADFIMISVSSKYVAAFLPFLILAFYTIQHFYLRTSRQMRLLDIEYKAPLLTQLIETLDGLVTIRAFQWEDSFKEKNMGLLNDSQKPSYLLYCLQRWLVFAVDMMVAFLALILIVVTTTLREQIGPGYMGIALSHILAFSGTVKATVTSWIMLEVALGAIARVRSFALETKSEDVSDGSLTKPNCKDWPSQGAVELRDVTASYPSSGIVLNNVTFSVQPGQRVAICGRTGSGKSSLTLCLLRMMDQDGGSITIDGIDLATLPHEYVRSKLVAVPQESYIFDGTVRLNIDPSESVSDEEIVLVLEKVQLWGRIEQRGGLDVLIHDKFFSQGEEQLFVFARAMLRKSKVLILDEITSSLDDETSSIIDNILRSWFQGWTVIAIAHKLDSILKFDRVAVLDAGKLVEYDVPQRLLDRDSAFQKLYKLSSGRGKERLPREAGAALSTTML